MVVDKKKDCFDALTALEILSPAKYAAFTLTGIYHSIESTGGMAIISSRLHYTIWASSCIWDIEDNHAQAI